MYISAMSWKKTAKIFALAALALLVFFIALSCVAASMQAERNALVENFDAAAASRVVELSAGYLLEDDGALPIVIEAISLLSREKDYAAQGRALDAAATVGAMAGRVPSLSSRGDFAAAVGKVDAMRAARFSFDSKCRFFSRYFSFFDNVCD
jgi:hypothetical protein